MTIATLDARPLARHYAPASGGLHGVSGADARPTAGFPPVVAARRQCPVDLPLEISPAFTAEVLSPYRAHARYLKSARIDGLGTAVATPALSRVRSTARSCDRQSPLLSASGRFAIGESCYIADTGHFNAVEFNICFNQLAYVVFGKCFADALIPELSFLDFGEFRRAQLPQWLIVQIDGVRFSKQLDRHEFYAEFTLDEIRAVRGSRFFFTSIAFSDHEGVKTSGNVVLSYSGDKA